MLIHIEIVRFLFLFCDLSPDVEAEASSPNENTIDTSTIEYLIETY